MRHYLHVLDVGLLEGAPPLFTTVLFLVVVTVIAHRLLPTPRISFLFLSCQTFTPAIRHEVFITLVLQAKRLVALAVVPRGLEVIARGTLISGSLILAALFVKPHGVFD